MTIKLLTRYFIGLGMISTLMYLTYIGLWAEPLTGFTVFFVAWLLLPYMIWLYINELHQDSFSKHPRIYIGLALAIPMVGVGIVGYVSHFPDPQAGFFFFYIPFMQLICLWVAWGVCKK